MACTSDQAALFRLGQPLPGIWVSGWGTRVTGVTGQLPVTETHALPDTSQHLTHYSHALTVATHPCPPPHPGTAVTFPRFW